MIEVDADDISLDDVPVWGFDSSSTQQAEGLDSDCILQPVRVYKNPLHDNACFVLFEVFTRAGERYESNYRGLIDDAEAEEFCFGFEQEYVLMTSIGRPVGFPDGGYPEPQGPYRELPG